MTCNQVGSLDEAGLITYILLLLDEQAGGAINQTWHGKHILLSLGQTEPKLYPYKESTSTFTFEITLK